MRRRSEPPRYKHITRVFVFEWTKCFKCGDEVCLERMWEFDTAEGVGRRHFVYFCSICAHSKLDVLRICDGF